MLAVAIAGFAPSMTHTAGRKAPLSSLAAASFVLAVMIPLAYATSIFDSAARIDLGGDLIKAIGKIPKTTTKLEGRLEGTK